MHLRFIFSHVYCTEQILTVSINFLIYITLHYDDLKTYSNRINFVAELIWVWFCVSLGIDSWTCTVLDSGPCFIWTCQIIFVTLQNLKLILLKKTASTKQSESFYIASWMSFAVSLLLCLVQC